MDQKVSISLSNIQQSIDVGAWRDIERFILENHYALFSQGLHKQVSYWISCLPTAVRESHPINLQYAYALVPYQEEEAFNIFSAIFEHSVQHKNYELAYSAWTGLADCSFYNMNRFSELGKWLKKAKSLLKESSLPTEQKLCNAFIAAYFNSLLFCAPDKKRLIKWQVLAQKALNSSTNPETSMLLSNHLILVAIWQGDMFQARLLSKEFLGVDNLQNQNPLAFMVQKTMQAQVAWLNADKQESIRHVNEGLQYSKKSTVQSFDPQLMAQAVYACMVDNDFDSAEKYLIKIEKIKNPHHILDNAQYHYLRAWLAISLGKVDTAYVHGKRANELTKIAGVEFTEAATQTMLAQIYFEKNNLVRSIHHLARVQRIGRRMGSLHIRYAGLLAQTWAMFEFKRNLLALRYLRKAFKIGAEQGYVHIPGWPFKIMNHLCEVALVENIEPEYAKKLIRFHRISPADISNIPENWPWQIEINLFGQFQLIIDGKEWKSKRKSQQRPMSLLKLLALKPKGVHQNVVTDMLWEDAEGDSVIQLLHTTLHRLRKLLKSHSAITLKNGLLSLNSQLVHVDISKFIQMSNKPIETSRANTVYRQICDFYERGILLDEPEASWLIPIKETIRSDFLNYLFRIAEFMEKSLNKAQSINIYLKVIQFSPYTEKPYQALIQLYIQDGYHAEAMQTYQHCETALLKRFNIRPSEKTRALVSKL